MDQLEYARRLEEHYVGRIEDLLTPVLGTGRLRAQVALDVDFSQSEETSERFDPKQPPGMMRSEQMTEENSTRPSPVGIPGALSNQPPGVATAPEQVQSGGELPGEESAIESRSLRTRTESTRNYELDRHISHTRKAPGQILRISTAVVVDDYAGTGDNGEATRTPMSQEQIDRLTALVKEAVGFDAARGDTVNVLNAAFAESPISEIVIPLWQQRWFLELVKWGVIAALALVTLLTVVRPLVRSALGTSQLAETIVALGGPVA
jgi:flagellar M-ring protein FliF